MRERFRILQSPVLRDPRTERYIIEAEREMMFMYVLLAGCALLLWAVIF
jgi:hypothetical protein